MADDASAPVASRTLQELQQRPDYGGTPVGQIILRPGEDFVTVLWGFCLLLSVFVFFVFSIYAVLISDHMPYTGSYLVDAVKDDHYYCFLVPLTIPVTVIAVIGNWVAFKFFRHN